MLAVPAPGHSTDLVEAGQFLDLVCHDPDLLAAEFDAIIAAAWHDPPAGPATVRLTGSRSAEPNGR
jgi:hypothetical protein